MGVEIPSEQVEREEKATKAVDWDNVWTKQFPWSFVSGSGEAPKVYVVTDPSSIIPIPKFDPGTSFLE